jgi:hypothetical protein
VETCKHIAAAKAAVAMVSLPTGFVATVLPPCCLAHAERPRTNTAARRLLLAVQSMIPKSGSRFSDKIMLKQKF